MNGGEGIVEAEGGGVDDGGIAEPGMERDEDRSATGATKEVLRTIAGTKKKKG